MEFRQHQENTFKEVTCAILSVSEILTPETDLGGREILQMLRNGSHSTPFYKIIKDSPQEIERSLQELSKFEKLQVIILTGGTGLSRRDLTFETIERLLEKKISGFGELFRFLSFLEIGPAGMISRATAGVYQGKLIFSLPGSVSAIRLAMEKLILPEMGHMVWDILA